MLNIEELKAVRTIVTHANCPDGIASALVLHDVLPEAEIIFAQYETPKLDQLEARPGMLFCDFSPPKDRIAEFIHAKSIVLDHHRTAKAVVEAFGSRGVFADEVRDNGVSGAVLAFREVWAAFRQDAPGHQAAASFWRELARLAGVRDTWQRSSPDWTDACAQAEALRFWPWERLHEADVDRLMSMLEIGAVLLEKQAEAVDKIVGEAFRFVSSGGLRVAVFNSTSLTSDAAEKIGAEADLVMGFHYQVDSAGARIVWSCRSRGDFDVAAFAKQYGGGGHTRAAGFTMHVELGRDAMALNPYSEARFWVESFAPAAAP